MPPGRPSNRRRITSTKLLLTGEPGPGFFHIPLDHSRGWLDQLPAESRIFAKRAGATVRRWHLGRGRANEAFDTLIYVYAAVCGLHAVRGFKMDKTLAMIETMGLVPIADARRYPIRRLRQCNRARRSITIVTA